MKKRLFHFLCHGAAYLRDKQSSASRAENKTKNEVFCFLSRGAAYLRRRQSTASHGQNKMKKRLFHFLCHGAAYLRDKQSSASRTQCQEKVVFFLSIVEAPPIFAAGIVWWQYHFRGFNQPCTAERNP